MMRDSALIVLGDLVFRIPFERGDRARHRVGCMSGTSTHLKGWRRNTIDSGRIVSTGRMTRFKCLRPKPYFHYIPILAEPEWDPQDLRIDRIRSRREVVLAAGWYQAIESDYLSTDSR